LKEEGADRQWADTDGHGQTRTHTDRHGQTRTDTITPG
jgi:protocatechuate 3,4-dioxygenase beta subunit